MFGKRSLNQPALAEPQGAPAGAVSLGALAANPPVAAAGAGFAFLVAAAMLVAVAGDPDAGAPRVKVPLVDPESRAVAPSVVSPVAPSVAPVAAGVAPVAPNSLVVNGNPFWIPRATAQLLRDSAKEALAVRYSTPACSQL